MGRFFMFIGIFAVGIGIGAGIGGAGGGGLGFIVSAIVAAYILGKG